MVSDVTIRLGTRGSELALWQANYTAARIRALGREVELVILRTRGDQDQVRPVTDLGGVGVFVKRLQVALFEGEIDLAVHSLKDLPTEPNLGLVVAAYPERAPAGELLIVRAAARVEPSVGPAWIPLAHGARVGTASTRRRAQLLELRPDLEIVPIRGNVPTRVNMAREGQVDAVILARAGVDRLELSLDDMVRVELPLESFLPAPGQGALALEVRSVDVELIEFLSQLNDPIAAEATGAERLCLNGIGAGCSVPLGTLAWRDEQGLYLEAILQANPPAKSSPSEVAVMRRAFVRAPDAASAAAAALRVLSPRDLLPLALPELAGRRVLIAREEDPAAELVEALSGAGALATCAPPTRSVLCLESAAWREALSALPPAGWVLFASARAVKAAASLSDSLRADLARCQVGAVGPATARALAIQRVAVDLLAPELASNAEGFADALLVRLGAERPQILLPAARGGLPDLGDRLTAAGCALERLELYTSEPCAPPQSLEADALLLASPSGARVLLAGHAPGATPPLVAIGPTTAAEIRALGHTPAAVAETPTLSGQLAALRAALAR